MNGGVGSVLGIPAQGVAYRDGSDPAVAQAITAMVRSRLSSAVRAEELATGMPVSPGRSDELAEALLAEELEAFARAELSAGRRMPSAEAEAVWAKAVRDHLFGLGGLQPYLDMEDVENINVIGCDRVFLRRTGNRREPGAWPVARSDEELIELIRTLAARAGEEERRFDRGSPMLDLQLPDGSRLNAAAWTCPRPAISIRRHLYPDASLADLVRLGTLDDDLAAFLAAAVRAKLNLLVAGGTGLGKTTMLRALAGEIGPEERLVTIENAFELNLHVDVERHPEVVAFQARLANVEGAGAITQADLVHNALRMSPDRVVVGEVRGEELLPMIAAMSQGNDGSMATIHASDSQQVGRRLALYAAKGRDGLRMSEAYAYVASAVNLIVQLDYSRDGVRVVSSVREVIDADDQQLITNEVYRPDAERRAVPTGALSAHLAERLQDAGYEPPALSASAGPGWSYR